jgi:AAA+ superfamily predicted ATPase
MSACIASAAAPLAETACEEQTGLTSLHLALRKLDDILSIAVDRIQREFSPRGALDALRGLHVSELDVRRALEDRSSASADTDAVGAIAAALRSHPGFERLRRHYGLEDFDLVALLIALAPETDLRYQRIYAYLQDDVTRKRPTVDLLLTLLCASDAERLARRSSFASDAPLLQRGLVELITDPNYVHPPLIAQYVKPDEQIVRLLLGDAGLDSRVAHCCRVAHPANSTADLESSASAPHEVGESCLWLHGPDSAQQLNIAESLATKRADTLLVLDASRVATSEIEQTLRLALRDAALRPATLFVTQADSWLVDPHTIHRIAEATRKRRGLVIFGATGDMPTALLGIARPVALSQPTRVQRARSWQRALDNRNVACDAETIATLAARFRLTTAQITSAVDDACCRVGAAPQADDFLAAARAQSGEALATVADRIIPRATWDDIVLPEDAIEQMRELCQRVDCRDRVLDDWGFGDKLSRGRGTAALFSGGSGTGKTMAAEVIANALGLDLYRIDLARVVSKFIGETEKNLSGIFDAAEGANAILFFDEADALFGKRSEVKDAHDRYANVEISYLLQRMEEYDGIAILATNLPDHLDTAFARRLAFSVHFPFPDERSQLSLWSRAWPRETPLAEDMDREALAREHRLSGGSIRNVALASAFHAVTDDSSIAMRHVRAAIERESQKLRKSTPLIGATATVEGRRSGAR